MSAKPCSTKAQIAAGKSRVKYPIVVLSVPALRLLMASLVR